MQNIILDIFDGVNVKIPELPETEKELEEQIENILEAIQEQMPNGCHIEIDRYLFEVSGIAERKGFELGVKFITRLLAECLS